MQSSVEVSSGLKLLSPTAVKSHLQSDDFYYAVSQQYVLVRSDATCWRLCVVPLQHRAVYLQCKCKRWNGVFWEIKQNSCWINPWSDSTDLHTQKRILICAILCTGKKQEGMCAHPLKRVCLHSFKLHKHNCWTQWLRRPEVVDWITGFCRALSSKGICNFSREIT